VSRLTVKAITTSRFPPIPGGAAKGKQTMKVSVKGNMLVIECEMQEPTPSKGLDKNGKPKSLVVATSHGNHTTSIMVKGQALIVGVNAYIPNR
jgi:hypothetical protein